MRRDARAFLWDIREAADAVRRFVSGLDAQTYAGNDVVRSAVERKFEIIGEALNQLSNLDPALAARIPEARAIVAFRNVLIHGYAAVENDRVWQIAETSLPNLIAVVAELLDELGPP